MSGVRDRKRKMVSGLNEMYLENYKKTGAELIMGSGRFIGSENRGGRRFPMEPRVSCAEPM